MENTEDNQGVVPKKKERAKRDRRDFFEDRDKKLAKTLELHMAGVNNHQISKVVDWTPATVAKNIKLFSKTFKELKNVAEYKKQKADLLSAAQLAVLKSSLTDAKMKKASLLSGIQAFEILNKAQRLEDNLSTDNVSNRSIGMLKIDVLGDIQLHENTISSEVNDDDATEK